MTQLTVISPPAEEAVALDTAKAFLRIGHDHEDVFVAELLKAARLRLERISGLALVRQTQRLTWSAWPCDLTQSGARLPVQPVSALQAVQIRAADNAVIDLSDRFLLLLDRLHHTSLEPLPELSEHALIEIDLELGFGAVDDVPGDLQEAVLLMASAMYAVRTPGAFAFEHIEAVPADVEMIVNAYKAPRL